jgi:hypothetical protein
MTSARNDGKFRSFDAFSDADFKRTIWSALRLVAIAVALGVPLIWWKRGWPSAVLFLVGAVISGSGLFEWVRLMTALMSRMDANAADATEDAPARPVKPMAPVLIGFFLRLALAVVLLYGSLKLLDGSILALAAGLALGVFALSIEGLRLVKSWTV